MGLLSGMAKSGAVAGAVTAVSKRISERQALKSQQQAGMPPPQGQAVPAQTAQPQAPASPATGEDALGAQLRRLADLNAQGLITDDEFAAAKAKALGI